jgi:hypothetical protein
VKQLNDIDFSEESEDDFEDCISIKRQRRTVLTEENMRKYLSEETQKLNLEHHYWLKDSFLSKLGKLAPNLKELSLKRLHISNESFKDLVHYLTKLEKLDITECPLIEESGMLHLFEKCGETLKELVASNCQDAITDNTLKALTEIKDEEEEAPVRILSLLDISFCKRVTDDGLAHF